MYMQLVPVIFIERCHCKLTTFTALRLLPPDPLILRMANTDTFSPEVGGRDRQDSLVIRKGQRILISDFGSHRNPTHFGVDAPEFRPSRWDDINVNTLGYVPFSIGSRACLGRE
jgi:cytochrome P450